MDLLGNSGHKSPTLYITMLSGWDWRLERFQTLQPDVYVWTQLDFLGVYAGYRERGWVAFLLAHTWIS